MTFPAVDADLDRHYKQFERANERRAAMTTLEELYKAACWEHHQAQQPWDSHAVGFWHGVAAGLAWALSARGLNDRQLRQMEDDAIALGPSGRWDGIIEKLDRPDGTVSHDN